MTIYAIGNQMFNTGVWNGPSFDFNPIGEHAVLYNQRSITLNWTSIPLASSYRVQASLFPDMRDPFLDVTGITASTYTFTDNEDNDLKRYWRVRPYDGSTYFEPWGEVASYWLDTTAPEQIVLAYDTWAMADTVDTDDVYVFDLFPIYQVVPDNLYRTKQRNRLGELLSEYLTTKDRITLSFQGSQFVYHDQLDEFERFNTELRTFYLCAFKQGFGERPFPHIWKVEFTDDPSMTMLGAGRQDIFNGTLIFEEV